MEVLNGKKDKTMIDVDIYLDVDGVLFTHNKGRLYLRDGMLDFLIFITNNFNNCYCLTTWDDGFGEILKSLYAKDIADKIKVCKWDKIKSKSLNYERDFIWIEDTISTENKEVLKENGCLDKYIEAPSFGDLAYLFRLIKILKKRFYIEEA